MRDLPMVGWLLATLVATMIHPFVPAPRWLMLHLLLLGAAGHAILVWSRYFADTLLRSPAAPRAPQTRRLAAYNGGVVLVVAGVLAGQWWLTVLGAVAIAGAVAWHGVTLLRRLRRALGSRFTPTVRFYVAAAAILPCGVTLGVLLAREPASPWHEQLRAAHVALNAFGWIGLTVLGTLVTLLPTMLRTRIVPGAERAAVRALPVLVAGVGVAAGGALAGHRPTYAAGLACYAVGVGMLADPALRTVAARRPSSFPAWSAVAALAWLAGCLLWLAVGFLTADSWLGADRALGSVTPFLAAGFAAQVLLGASSYLIPVVLGGGPRAVRAADRVLERGSEWRLVATNAGLLVCALPVPSLVRVLASFLVLGAMAAFLPLLFSAMRASRRMRAATTEALTDPPTGRPVAAAPGRPAGQRTGLAAGGLAAVVLAVAVGAALDPAALTQEVASAQAGVAATGHTTRVEVVAEDMRFHPSRIEVPAGDRLVIVLRNEDDGDTHDLVLETGAESGRLAPGDSAEIDVGVVGRALDGWCSIVGHRQMGMVLAVEAIGASSGGTTADDDEGAGHDHSMTHGEDEGDDAVLDPMAAPGAGVAAYDATLPPLGRGRVHRRTFTVTEQEAEVAPGVRQVVWTYDGTSPGPILHGRVGDVFEITLVNDGTMGHSIDFHAGSLAPDEPMRTISPGESLVYRFRATRAGIWMYHCSTMPMATHIAAGLYGAVVIDPPGLPRVDRSYVLVQAEHYFGPEGGDVDAAQVATGVPDAVSFNGYAFGYDHDPLPARVGERVRVWVLAAGPNDGTSFHVVGGQFDRVWSEGAWLLGDADAPARDTGAQVLSLGAAQGGFVELAFPEAGHYPFVDHEMADAERGAHGLFAVTP